MGQNFYFFISAFIFNLYYYLTGSLASPIIGGIADTNFFIKYHVSVQIKRFHQDYRYLCGGSIIHERYVLSAAHCFLEVEYSTVTKPFNLLETPTKVIAGTNSKDGPGIDDNVVTIFIPKVYQIHPTYTADLAVLQLEDNLRVADHPNRLHIVPVGQVYDSSEDSSGSMCGYGYYEGEMNEYGQFVVTKYLSEINRFLPVTILGTNQLENKYKNPANLYAVATNHYEHTTACHGDSGAGLIQYGKIVGVLGAGSEGCKSDKDPLEFTKVSFFKQYIDSAMKEHGAHSDLHVLEGSKSNIPPPYSHPQTPQYSPSPFPHQSPSQNSQNFPSQSPPQNSQEFPNQNSQNFPSQFPHHSSSQNSQQFPTQNSQNFPSQSRPQNSQQFPTQNSQNFPSQSRPQNSHQLPSQSPQHSPSQFPHHSPSQNSQHFPSQNSQHLPSESPPQYSHNDFPSQHPPQSLPVSPHDVQKPKKTLSRLSTLFRKKKKDKGY